MEDFMSVKKFNVFNTNSLWIKLSAIKRVVTDDILDMELIVNPVSLDSGSNGYQLVTAIGAAMKCFENAVGLNVPRSRFLPVKKTSDLLLLMSNLYTQQHGQLRMSPRVDYQVHKVVLHLPSYRGCSHQHLSSSWDKTSEIFLNY